MKLVVKCCLSFILVGCFQKKQLNVDANKKYYLQLDSINNIINEGDIVFRGGTDIESDIIRNFSTQDKTFSHCGIVLKNDTGFFVTHILGGYTNPKGTVLNESIGQFLKYPDNESAGIYQSGLNASELKRIYYFIDSLKKKDVVFDLKFNLFTKDKLYCTEFLIDAISYTKSQKAQNLFIKKDFEVKNSKYFFLANSNDKFVFYSIDVFQNNSLLKLKKIFYFPNYANHY